MEVPLGIAAWILLLWVLSFFDYYLTVYQVCMGAVEINPILAPLFNSHRYMAALAVKMLLTFPGICILSLYHNRPAASRALPLVVLVYIGLLVYHVLNLFI